MSSPIDLGSDSHSERARQLNFETGMILLVQAMGGSVVFNSSELLDVFNKIERNEITLVVTQYQDPWQVRMKVVERE